MTQRERLMTLTLGRRWRWSRPPTGQSERAGPSQASAGIFKDFLELWELVTVKQWLGSCLSAFGGSIDGRSSVFSSKASREI